MQSSLSSYHFNFFYPLQWRSVIGLRVSVRVGRNVITILSDVEITTSKSSEVVVVEVVVVVVVVVLINVDDEEYEKV